MKTLFYALVVAAALTSSLHAEEPTWSRRMQSLSQALSELLPDLTSQERFSNPQNADRIKKHVQTLSKAVHAIGKRSGAKPVDTDPTLHFVAELLEQEVARAQRELGRGNRAYARSVLKSVTGYCISCHTRSSSGPQFPELKLSADLESLKPAEKAEYFVATRQFDRAYAQYENLLSNTAFARSQKLDWEQAAKTALAVAVRVQRNPGNARHVVDLVLKQKEAPYFVRTHAASWREAIDQWEKEPKKSLDSAEGFFAEATRLTAMAKQQQKYPADHAADVWYLRSSAAAHDVLAKELTGERASQALYLAGLSYEALDDASSIHELYYESCIRTTPASEIAQQCYRRLEEVLYFGYSGSGGTSIPDDVAARLERLKKTAGVKDSGVSSGE